jgi:predicted alpha-1,6-mannanase (GH76 family)
MLSGSGGGSGGGGRGHGVGGGGVGDRPDAGEPEALDPTGLRIEPDEDGDLCRLSPDGRALFVRVRNDGEGAAPAAVVEVATADTASSARASATGLAPSQSVDVRFDRGALLGFAGAWRFEVTLDPDGALGIGPLALEGRCDDLRARARAAMAALDAFYDDATGRWSPDWWRAANTVEAAVDYARETGDASYVDAIGTTFEKRKTEQGGDFLNEYYDDEGWWALAWVKAYDLTHDAEYLAMAKTIFADMAQGWNPAHCGGGLYWRKTDETKNAIPNELFLTLAARLHLRTPGDEGAGSYLEWAEREWAWFEASGMLGEDGLVVDGIDRQTCAPGGEVFTYNQGVILGGLVDLFRSNGDARLLDVAETIARAVLRSMTSADGVLLEVARPSCEGDCVPFKGVFARYAAELYGARPFPELQAFLRRQSDALFRRDRNAEDQFGSAWTGPFDTADAARQTAALDGLVGAVRAASPNLALGGAATGSAACSATEVPARAIDGTAAFGSKFCAGGASGQTLVVDLGAPRYVVGFRVRHAGDGGEDPAWNTRDFEIETSLDGSSYAPSVAVTDNTADVTTHFLPGRDARYVRLHVTTAQTRADLQAARIYELEVFGAGL